MTRLVSLDVANNNISDLEGIENLLDLEKLILKENNLDEAKELGVLLAKGKLTEERIYLRGNNCETLEECKVFAFKKPLEYGLSLNTMYKLFTENQSGSLAHQYFRRHVL